jgi:hypothetical protein
MLTGLAARTVTSPPRATLYSLATVSSPGLPSARTPCQGQVQKSSIARWPMEWQRPIGCASFFWSCTPPRRAILVYCDNISAVYMTSNPVQHQRTKHIEIDLHFVRGRDVVGDVRVLHVPTRSQYANIFTKRLPSTVFTEFRSNLNVVQSG